MELADQAKSFAVAVDEPCDLVSAVGRISHEDEAAIRKPAEHHCQEPDHVLSWCTVPVPLTAVGFLGLVEGDQDGQRPRAGGEWEANKHGEYDPFVAVPPCRVGMRRANRIAMSVLAKDVRPGMGDDCIVASQNDGSILGQ